MSEFDNTKDNEIIETNDDFENDEFVKNKIAFIERYKAASNTANATIDDNSNVFNKNIAIINSEIHKKDNTRISRAMVISKLKELYPNFNAKRYIRDLEDHVIYKHDESSFAGAIAPYTYSSKEVVYVKYNDKPYLVPFDLLYDIVKENEVLVDKHNIVYQKYPKNLYIYDKNNTWTHISHITKKKRHRDLVRIKTYFGEDLIVTDNHPMIVDIDDTDNTVEAIKSLGKKQYKTDMQFIFNNDDNESLDLTNIFGTSTKEYNDYILYKDDTTTHLPQSICVDREFGKFIGLFISKGKFNENNKSIEITFNSYEQANKWSHYLQYKFNIADLNYTFNRGALIILNEFLYDLLKEYFLINDSIYNKTLPANVLSFNDRFALGILEGLFNTDLLNNNSLYYQSTSRSLILQISAILKYFGYALEHEHNAIEHNYKRISVWSVSAHKLSNIKDTDFYEYRMGGETIISDVYKLYNTDPFVESQNEFIYDITTSTRTFALNNILVHNCTSITMYPFLMDGIKGLGGLSASPKNLKSFCGIFCNMIFAISSQFAGACLYKDQKLLINNNNLSYNIKIKDFVNKFNLTNKFSNYQGDWEYTDISNQDYFVEEDEKKVKINKVYRRKYSDEIYKIKTHSGLECRVSKDHKFKVLYRGRIIEVPAHDLKQYDTVFVSTDHSCMIDKNSQDYRDGQFLGIICGDGSVTNKNYVRIAIHKDQMYIKDFLDSYFMDVYGKIGSCALDPRKNAMCYNYTVSSMSIRNKICDLLTPCERHDTYTKNVDIENKSLDFQIGFLDGLLVTDGNFSLDKSIRISLTNEGLIDTVIKIVKNINIPCGKKTGGKVYEKQTNKRPVYNFCVPSKVRKYLQLAPLKVCKSSIERTSKRKDANDKLQGKETYYLGPSHAEDAHGNKFICRGNTHNEVYKQYRTDVVESIETFKNDDKYVYEIETETHWYNCGGMITHNCATSEALLYFTYFCKKEWGDDFYKRLDEVVGCSHDGKQKTILSEIQQYWQQIVYTINQPAAARGFQSAFVNFSYFDKPFFEGMFGEFYFPDGTKPDWESLKVIQMEFMKWFNAERLKTILTFPVETVTLLYKDGKFLDEDMYNFVCDEYARGHSFFTYISDTVDSLSSCCRLKNKLQTKEFNFTNGNIGIQTGSKSVITFNLNRIIQLWYRKECERQDKKFEFDETYYTSLKKYLTKIIDRVYKYHHAYNELLWDMHDAGLLPAYKAGFINLNKQYLTLGINGLNQAAEFLGMKCNDNPKYSQFCQEIFSLFKEQNELHKDTNSKHHLIFNTEQVPAESLGVKNYNFDKQDGFWTPDDTNLYASYIFKPNDPTVSVLEKIRMHGKNYIGEYLDGGAACHLNLDSHLSSKQYKHILEYAAKNGCNYLTFNVPNAECQDCGFIAKQPFDKCPKCGSDHVDLWDRIIGYITKIKNWSDARQKEFTTRIHHHIKDDNIDE